MDWLPCSILGFWWDHLKLTVLRQTVWDSQVSYFIKNHYKRACISKSGSSCVPNLVSWSSNEQTDHSSICSLHSAGIVNNHAWIQGSKFQDPDQDQDLQVQEQDQVQDQNWDKVSRFKTKTKSNTLQFKTYRSKNKTKFKTKTETKSLSFKTKSNTLQFKTKTKTKNRRTMYR